MKRKSSVHIFFIISLFLIISCNVENNNNKSKTIETDKKETISPEYKKIQKETENQISETEFMTREEIIKAELLPRNPVTKRAVRDFKVNISQIDNSKFPEVSLIVNVTDKAGNPLSVDPKTFHIEEYGLPISRDQIISIQQKKDLRGRSSDLPLNVILAIDKSGSMAGEGKHRVKDPRKQPLWFAMQASINFIKQADNKDLIRVLAFDGDLHPLGSNYDAIEKIKELKPRGSTALYGALLASVQMLQIGKGIKAVILLSDGKNDTKGSLNRTLKSVTLKQGILAADQVSIPVFSIGFGKNFDEYTLKKIAKETHALYFQTAKKEEINSLYRRIKRIINTQYVITYKSRSLQEITNVGIGIGRVEDQRAFTVPEHIIKQQNELLSKISVIEKERKRLNEFEKELNSKLGKINKDRAYLESRENILSESKEKLAAERNKLETKESQITQLNRKLQNLDAKTQTEGKRLKNLRLELEGKGARLGDQEKRLNDLRTALEQRDRSVENKDESLKEREDKLKRELEKLRTNMAKLTRKLISVENQEAQLKRELRENTSLRSRLDKTKEELRTEKDRLIKVKHSIDTIIEKIQNKHKQALEDIKSDKGDIDRVKP